MFKTVKDHVLPHLGNDHRPRILHTEGLRALIAIVVLIELLFLAQVFLHPSSDYLAAVIKGIVVDETNRHRAEDALTKLTVNPLLEEAARRKAQDMATNGYFAHVSPTGVEPWKWLKDVGYYYLSAGENLAVNFTDSKDVTDAWMNSPTHRANMLNGNFTEIGIGTAEGIYQGKHTTFVVQYFGRPYDDAFEETIAVAKHVQAPTVGSVTPRPSSAPAVSSTGAKSRNASTSTATTTQKKAKITRITMKDPTLTDAKVLGVATTPVGDTIGQASPTMLGFLTTNPRHVTLTMLVVAFALVLLALVLTFLIRKDKHHIDLYANGLAFIAMILFVIMVNDYLSVKDFSFV